MFCQLDRNRIAYHLFYLCLFPNPNIIRRESLYLRTLQRGKRTNSLQCTDWIIMVELVPFGHGPIYSSYRWRRLVNAKNPTARITPRMPIISIHTKAIAKIGTKCHFFFRKIFFEIIIKKTILFSLASNHEKTLPSLRNATKRSILNTERNTIPVLTKQIHGLKNFGVFGNVGHIFHDEPSWTYRAYDFCILYG